MIPKHIHRDEVLASAVPYHAENMHVESKIVTQLMRKFKKFAKMCGTCKTSPKLVLRTVVTTSHITGKKWYIE